MSMKEVMINAFWSWCTALAQWVVPLLAAYIIMNWLVDIILNRK